MKTRLPLIFLLLAVLLAVIPLQAFAEERAASPAIEISARAPPRNYPIRIYVYQQTFQNEQADTPFPCEWTSKIMAALHEALHDLRGSILRFIDEHPEFRELALIHFTNASSPSDADITFKIVDMIAANPDFEGVTYLSGRVIEIAVVCRLGGGAENDAHDLILHELLHALGLGHAKQQITEDKSEELMWPKSSTHVKQYPTTLDLYALYMVHFGSASGGVVTLPNGMRYEMVVPYAQEIQTLRRENQKLKDQVNTSSMLFEKMKQERDALRDKLAEANASLQDLREQYEAIRNILDSYIRAYNSLQQRYEALRGNCSLLLNVCNATYHELSAKLSEKHAALLNITQRYNECANQFNRLYEEHQKLQAEYDDLAGRFTFLAVIYFAVVAILGGGALWVSLAYGRLHGKYHELLERLEGGEEHE
jgi:archaellum component FlaC